MTLTGGNKQHRQHCLKRGLTETVRLQGRVAWNKGKKLSLETRQKMSLAKQGRHIPRSVRRQISKSHQGLTHTPVCHPFLCVLYPMEELTDTLPSQYSNHPFFKPARQAAWDLSSCL